MAYGSIRTEVNMAVAAQSQSNIFFTQVLAAEKKIQAMVPGYRISMPI